MTVGRRGVMQDVSRLRCRDTRTWNMFWNGRDEAASRVRSTYAVRQAKSEGAQSILANWSLMPCGMSRHRTSTLASGACTDAGTAYGVDTSRVMHAAEYRS